MLMTIQMAKAAAAVVFGAAMLIEPRCDDIATIVNFETGVTAGDVVSTQFRIVGTDFLAGPYTERLLVVSRPDAPSAPNVMRVSASSSPSVLITMPKGAFTMHARVAVDATSTVQVIAYGPGITEIGRTSKQIEAGAGFADVEYTQRNGIIERMLILGADSRVMHVDDLIIGSHAAN